MNEVVQRLDDTAAARAAVDLDALSDAELHELTIGTRRALERLSLGVARCVARWDHRQLWADDQSRSARARLAREVSCSTTTAGRDLRRARTLHRTPAAASAVADGALSMDHLDLLGAAETASPDRFACDEPTLVDQCAALPRYDQAATVIAYWRQHADPDGAATAAVRAADSSSWHASSTLDGTVVVNGTLDPINGTIYLDELDRLTNLIRHADERDGVVRLASQRRSAAQVEMAKRSAAMPPDSKLPRPSFVALIGDDTVANLCQLANGHVIAPNALTPHFDTADLHVVLFDGPSTVLSVSKRRTFTGALRRAIEARDRHCQHPSSCDIPAPRCDVDHIIPWTESHRTDQFNGRLQCPTHNRRADRHDHHAQPLPARDITYLDTLRARLRWEHHHLYPPDDDDDPPAMT